MYNYVMIMLLGILVITNITFFIILKKNCKKIQALKDDFSVVISNNKEVLNEKEKIFETEANKKLELFENIFNEKMKEKFSQIPLLDISMYQNGQIKRFCTTYGEKKYGQEKFYFDNGKLNKVQTWNNGILDGKSTTYYKTGEEYIVSIYENGELKSSKIYNKEHIEIV